jgi:hypothetical protein
MSGARQVKRPSGVDDEDEDSAGEDDTSTSVSKSMSNWRCKAGSSLLQPACTFGVTSIISRSKASALFVSGPLPHVLFPNSPVRGPQGIKFV